MDSAPETHDGEKFSVRILFSEDIANAPDGVKAAFSRSGAELRKAARVENATNLLWELRFKPRTGSAT